MQGKGYHVTVYHIGIQQMFKFISPSQSASTRHRPRLTPAISFMLSTAHLVTFFVLPLAVLACEGECIVNITKEYLTLYSAPIRNAFQDLVCTLPRSCPPCGSSRCPFQAYQIDAKIVPSANRRQDPISYFAPVFHAFDKVSYNGLEHAIFPSYFHGKCLYPDGTVPNGCPNPDCPVVCGTPGSMVHFYPDLRRIVFDQISGQLANITSPGTRAYQQVQKAVLFDAQRTQRRLSRITRSAKPRTRGTAALEKQLGVIMKRFPSVMRSVCGGSGLSKCSWETSMKKYILQFP